MNALAVFKNQQQQVDAAIRFQEICAVAGLQIDLGQAYECCFAHEAGNQLAAAKKFHHGNKHINRSCGAVHFGVGEDFFDLAAPESEPWNHSDFEVDLIEKIQVIPNQTRKILVRVVMELRRPGGAHTIVGAAAAMGVSRSHFYRLLERARWWALRPAPPEGWAGNDCSLLQQLNLDFGM